MLYSLENIISPTEFFSYLKKKITKKELDLADVKIHKSKSVYEKVFNKVSIHNAEVHFELVYDFHKKHYVTRRTMTQGMMIELMYQSIILIQICVALQEQDKTLIDLPKVLNKHTTSFGELMFCGLSPKTKAILYQMEYAISPKRNKYGMKLKFNRLVGRTEKIYFEKQVSNLDQFIDVMFVVIDECTNLFNIRETAAGKRILSSSYIDLRKGIPPFKLLKLINKEFNSNRYYFSDDLPTNTYSLAIIKKFIDRKK